MNIFFFIHHLGNGGAERVTSVLANGLAANGHKVTIGVYASRSNLYELHSNVTIKQVDSYYMSGLFAKIRKYQGIRKLILQSSPDVIIAVMPFNYIAAKIASLGLSIPIVVSDHTTFSWNPTFKLKFIRYYLYAFADAVTVLTKRDKEMMSSYLHNTKVMYNPLSFPITNKAVLNRKKNIISVGRLSVWNVKGFDLLLESWAQIHSNYPEWVLKIAGDGDASDYEFIRNKTIALGIEHRVELLGFISNIKDVLEESSIFALSSRIEGFPCSLIEAMSQGCACVSYSINGIIKEIITDGEDGYIIEDGDVVSFSSAIEKLILDENKRNSIGEQAKISMQKLNAAYIITQWELFLKTVIDKK